jgi:adenylate kinase family enzyme
MRRISVVGTSGAGKSTFARALADRIGAPLVELDGIFHQPGWTPLGDSEFVTRVEVATRGDSWVVDGNYRIVTREGPVWARADTVVWIDPPDWVVMRQVTGRTARRVLGRTELWNGNREQLRGVLRWDPQRSIIRWAWTTRARNRATYSAAMQDPAFDHLNFVRLASRHESARFIERVATD